MNEKHEVAASLPTIVSELVGRAATPNDPTCRATSRSGSQLVNRMETVSSSARLSKPVLFLNVEVKVAVVDVPVLVVPVVGSWTCSLPLLPDPTSPSPLARTNHPAALSSLPVELPGSWKRPSATWTLPTSPRKL